MGVGGLFSALIKKKIKFGMEQFKVIYMTNGLLIYYFATAPFRISLYMRKILFSFLAVRLPLCRKIELISALYSSLERYFPLISLHLLLQNNFSAPPLLYIAVHIYSEFLSFLLQSSWIFCVK